MGTQNLIQFVDKVVWRDNAINWAPVYCDISEHFFLILFIARAMFNMFSQLLASRLHRPSGLFALRS